MNPKKFQPTIESPAPKLVTYRVTSKVSGLSLRIDAFSPEEARHRFRDAAGLSHQRPDNLFEVVEV